MRRRGPKTHHSGRQIAAPLSIRATSEPLATESTVALIPSLVDQFIERGLQVRGTCTITSENGRLNVATKVEFWTPERPWRAAFRWLSRVKADRLLKLLGMFKSASSLDST